jgi:hypothetical protein
MSELMESDDVPLCFRQVLIQKYKSDAVNHLVRAALTVEIAVFDHYAEIGSDFERISRFMFQHDLVRLRNNLRR